MKNKFLLGKIYNSPKYGESFLDGKIYINPLAAFGVGKLLSENPDMNKHRDDLNEGNTKNVSASDIFPDEQIVSFFEQIGGIPDDAGAIGEIDSRLLSENVFCLSAIHFDQESRCLTMPSSEMIKFEDNNRGTAIVIYNVAEFIRRIVRTLELVLGSQYWMAYGLVDYDSRPFESRELDEFTKDVSYSYQDEFRIAIKIYGSEVKTRKDSNHIRFNENGSMVLDIGCIRDIAFSVDVEDFVQLRFSPEFENIKYREPSPIYRFYPPVKNEVSYICPLIRVEDIIYISKKQVYPIMRDPHQYSINIYRLEQMKEAVHAKDALLIEIMEKYFMHQLDICKCDDKDMLDSLLTAILRYMVELGITECAGLYVRKEAGTFWGEYRNTEVCDNELLQTGLYETVHRKSILPFPTDFAELLTISDQRVFEEYEFGGKKYVRIVVSKDYVLSSGRSVSAGEAVWVEVSKIEFRGF